MSDIDFHLQPHKIHSKIDTQQSYKNHSTNLSLPPHHHEKQLLQHPTILPKYLINIRLLYKTIITLPLTQITTKNNLQQNQPTIQWYYQPTVTLHTLTVVIVNVCRQQTLWSVFFYFIILYIFSLHKKF